MIFSTSECAPVRLASLVAERARAHWKGSKALEEEMPKVRSYFSQHEKRINVRGKFQESMFFT